VGRLAAALATPRADRPQLSPEAVTISTSVVLITEDHKTDELALRAVLETPAAYIGMIGSRRKRDQIFHRLRAEGFGEADLQRVHSPIGLNIGAETPEEIAVSITAEMIQIKRGVRF